MILIVTNLSSTDNCCITLADVLIILHFCFFTMRNEQVQQVQ